MAYSKDNTVSLVYRDYSDRLCTCVEVTYILLSSLLMYLLYIYTTMYIYICSYVHISYAYMMYDNKPAQIILLQRAIYLLRFQRPEHSLTSISNARNLIKTYPKRIQSQSIPSYTYSQNGLLALYLSSGSNSNICPYLVSERCLRLPIRRPQSIGKVTQVASISSEFTRHTS